MQDAEKEKLQKLISDELEGIVRHIKDLEARCQPISPDNAIGRISRMEAIGEQSVQQIALDAARQRQSELMNAIARIEQDSDFGYCEECDRQIPLARLMLVPESRFCVQCLQSAE